LQQKVWKTRARRHLTSIMHVFSSQDNYYSNNKTPPPKAFNQNDFVL